MKYYSEVVGKTYDTEKECLAAEQLALKAREEEKTKKEKEAAERKNMANEVEAARKAMVEAQKLYRDKLEAFVKRYGSYHMSWTDSKEIPTLFNLLSNSFFL